MKKSTSILFFSSLVGIMACGSAYASQDAVPLPGKGTPKITDRAYVCGGKPLNVKYIEKGNNDLAIIPVEGEGDLVFVRTLSGSGAVYSARQYTWSGKIDWMDLENQIQDKKLSCKLK